MIKSKELADANSCLNRASEHEMLFVLLERDITGPVTLRGWIEARVRYRKNVRTDDQIREAEECLKVLIRTALNRLVEDMAAAIQSHDFTKLERLSEIRKEIEKSRHPG